MTTVCVGRLRFLGTRGAKSAFSLLTLSVLACGHDIMQPDAIQGRQCEVPLALVTDADPLPIEFGALREAFLHAAGPMAAALESSSSLDLLRQAMNRLGAQEETASMDTACRFLLVASESLAALANSPETLPDREAIRLVLTLAAGAVQAAKP